ncbi:hypothetical protein CRUP_006233 [Coryphaenoides rupestris]|nr:hypothetical protein CRUP_006233 [Coryphaenoides rupestris]
MSSSPCRPFTMPLVLRTAHKPQFEQEDEEEEDASNMENQAPRDQFIQDPAVLRERAEATRAATQQRKGLRSRSVTSSLSFLPRAITSCCDGSEVR